MFELGDLCHTTELPSRYHPDKNKEEGAEEKFVEIAHGTLEDCDQNNI